MNKKFTIGCSIALLVAGQSAFAASVYTFSGQITWLSAYSPATTTTYSASGVHLGAPVSLRVSLDSAAQGYYTQVSNSVKTYEPYSQTFGNITFQEQWTRYAALVSSNINFAASADGSFSYNEYYNHTYSSPNSPDDFDGSIVLGNYLSISKTKDYGDTSAFVEYWKVGDAVDLRFRYNTGAGEVYAEGLLTLTSISAPLTAITSYSAPSAVPVPGASVLFLSGLACVGGIRKTRRRAV